LISFMLLFYELTCIRWFGSMVVYLTFFTNIILMACFLGMTVGCLAASRSQRFIRFTIPLALVSTTLTAALIRYAHRLNVDVGGQRSPQEVFFGTERSGFAPNLWQLSVPIEAIAGVFYVLIALMFVGLGQEMGRKLNAISNRVAAYTINIVGSLIGIVLFSVASYYRTTPMFWFAVVSGLCLLFLPRRSAFQLTCLISLLVAVGALANYTGIRPRSGRWANTVWSSYYRVVYTPRDGWISTNGISHQFMLKDPEQRIGYALPHLLNQAAGGRPFDDVLVIGAGSGNDVRSALANGAKHVDAVEIDDVLYEIGRDDHPNNPYSDRRVAIHIDDGRNFIRKTPRKYDLAIYALVDSLVLHSGYSSLRLESYLFTEQAFRDIKSTLKPGAVFVMSNFFRQGWVVGRLEKLAEKVFGNRPIIISLPYESHITSNESTKSHSVIMVGNTDSRALEAIRTKLGQRGFFWVSPPASPNEEFRIDFREKPDEQLGSEPDKWLKTGSATVDPEGIGRLPTDDWPFLYLREPRIPDLNIRGMVMIATLSLVILGLFAPVRTFRPNGQMFFLGAGFMLLETKGVVHMALLFGSTWVVNSVVFFAILVMVLLSNLFVLSVKPKTLWPYYVLLLGSLLVNAYVPMTYFLALPGASKLVASCTVVFVPVFFAGVIFAAAFHGSSRPDIDLGSNIGGVILGGLSEYFSLVLGFDTVLWIAIGFYLLSALLSPRLPALPLPSSSAPAS
jgi:spermidine synthase